MLIFLSFLQSTRKHPISWYEFWEGYVKRGLEEAGHQWVEAPGLDWVEGLTFLTEDERARWRSNVWTRALDSIRDRHRQRPIHLFLSYLFPDQVEVNAVRDIQALGIPCVNLFCDNVREFTSPPSSFGAFDLNWVPEFKALEMYRRAGFPTVFAAMPMWVAPEQRTWDHPEQYGPTFIGSRDRQREALFAEALRGGLSLELRGNGWSGRQAPASVSPGSPWVRSRRQLAMIANQGLTPWIRKVADRLQKSVPDAEFTKAIRPRPDASEYVAITQQSRIILGVNRYPNYRFPLNRPDTYSRLRDIEAPMLGACYLTEWAEGLDRMYELGTEIETYRDSTELIEKVRMLEADSGRRHMLRQRGQARSLAEHSVGASLIRIGSALGLNA